MEGKVVLTSAEKSQLQTSKQLYVFLRMINFVEKYYSYDKIDAVTYKAQINKLIEKYNKFTRVVPNYSLDSFIIKFNIPQEEISWAKLVLENGVNSEDNQGKETFLYMQAVAKFIEVIETLMITKDNPIVGDLRTPLQELQIILKKLHVKLGSQFSYKYSQYEKQLKMYVQSKSISESLIQSEYNQIEHTVKGMYKIMELIMKN